MEGEEVTRESWREREGERRARGNREKDIDREGEKGKRERETKKGKRGRESVCMFGG